jgi:transcriptional regulator with XRE-family HTH domain
MTTTSPFGTMLREWRQRRHLSQLDLALEAEVSSRHISFLETGRSQPSRDMLLRLADQLDVPLREQNAMLLSAGFAPAFPQQGLDSPSLQYAREAVEAVLAGHEPHPALAVDRHWNLIAANRATEPFFTGIAPELTQPPVNVLRATFHPDGVAPRIANFRQWRTHFLRRMQRHIELTADQALIELQRELRAYPVPASADRAYSDLHESDLVVPLRLRTDAGILTFLYTTTVFGTPLEVTLAEIAIESFFPANRDTAEVMREMNPAG